MRCPSPRAAGVAEQEIAMKKHKLKRSQMVAEGLRLVMQRRAG
jgi:hypothetical protein